VFGLPGGDKVSLRKNGAKAFEEPQGDGGDDLSGARPGDSLVFPTRAIGSYCRWRIPLAGWWPSANNFFDRKGNQVIDRDGRKIMEISHDEGFMVNGVAERLGISVLDFEVAFDEAIGVNPKNFFRQYRAVMARRLIQEGRNLHGIAYNLGFRHYSHFATEMKGFCGITPLRLKKLVEKRCGTMNPA